MTIWRATAGSVILVAMASGPALAQDFGVQSITATDLGNVAAGSGGLTTFRVDPASGSVTKVSGSGSRLFTNATRSLVTVSCGGLLDLLSCDANALITVSSTGTPTNRAASLQRFAVSVSGATARLVTTPVPGAPISFTIGPIGWNSSKTFWLGFDFPIQGDTSGASTGTSQAQFAVTISRTNGSGASTLTGTARATVFRSIAITKSTDLTFGRIAPPSSGTGTITLAQATGTVTVAGSGLIAFPSPAPSPATFAISGEGGQSISINVPSTFTMAGPSGELPVSTLPNLIGAQTLSGTRGSPGSLLLRIGGSFAVSEATEPGAYSGSFSVTVQYN